MKAVIHVFLVHDNSLLLLFLYPDYGEVSCVMSAISKQYSQ